MGNKREQALIKSTEEIELIEERVGSEGTLGT